MRARIEVSATGKNLFGQPECLNCKNEDGHEEDILVARSNPALHKFK
jgi:hypothetical protein